LHDALFAILIPTWNNLEMLKLCIRSITNNSTFKHQIVIHINEGSDGTLEWVKTTGLDYTHSDTNIGVCYALNVAAGLAKTDYLLYINDDMYVCPRWDEHLWNEIRQLPDNRFYLSATAIEPFDAGKKTAIAPFNFGLHAYDFREEEFLKAFDNLPYNDWNGSSWPPCIVHREVWNLAGGYSTEFFPGFYSDPDFAMKLWKLGIRVFKGVEKSRVYHFLEHSTKKHGNHKVVRANRLFLNKWGISAGMFYKHFLRMGTVYNGPLPEPEIDFAFRKKLFTGRIKRAILGKGGL
jgi:GT2 family glycosyltransferase